MPQAPAQNQAVAVFGNEKGAITYKVGGQDVKLSYSIVRNYLTKGNPNVPDQDVVQFMQICRYNSLNPFLGEAYLVKYGDSPAQMIGLYEADCIRKLMTSPLVMMFMLASSCQRCGRRKALFRSMKKIGLL